MARHGKARIAAIEALIATSEKEERRLRTIIESEQTSPEDRLKALTELAQLSTNLILKLADLQDDVGE